MSEVLSRTEVFCLTLAWEVDFNKLQQSLCDPNYCPCFAKLWQGFREMDKNLYFQKSYDYEKV